MEAITCEANVYSDERGETKSYGCASENVILLAKFPTYATEGKSSDPNTEVKSDSRKLTKVASEKSIFSSIRERLDPLTSLLQEGIEGTKEIFDRKLRKAESVSESQEISAEKNATGNEEILREPFDGLINNGDQGNVVLKRSSSLEDKKSLCADSFPMNKDPVLVESNSLSSTSLNEDALSEETSHVLSDFGERCSLETSGDISRLGISGCNVAARHYSFESCDFTAKELVFSRPLQPMTVFLWKKSKLFILSHKIKLLSGVVFAAMWLLLPFPSFVSGLILGFVLASGIAWALHCLGICTMHPSQKPFLTIKEDLAVTVESTVESKPLSHLEVFQGWMNEISSYEQDDFHLSKTRSVFVTIDKSILRLESPKYNLHRRAKWQERLPDNPEFILKREFSLTDSKVLLVPHGLVKKRLWCKKYPICIIASTTVTEANHEEIDAGIDVLKAFDSICITPASRSSDDSIKDASIDPDMESVFGDEETFHECKPKMVELFLFARANREKEEWYRWFVAGTQFNSHVKDEPPMPAEESKSVESHIQVQPRTSSSSESAMEIQNINAEESSPAILNRNQADYLSFMSTLVQPKNSEIEVEVESKNDSPALDELVAETESSKSPNPSKSLDFIQTLPVEMDLQWLNALLSRFFFDFLHERSWAEKMKEKLQAMLCKIHVPQFINQLTITDIDLGHTLPAIGHIAAPYLDNRGLWIDLNILYNGCFSITLETKCNLMKASVAKKEEMSESPDHGKRSAVTHSDEEDSAESSTDEEYSEDCGDPYDERKHLSSATSKRFLRFVDKITQSRYFQHAADYKYIKKALVEVSNTPLVLIVELSHISGTLALNIPPPPTDRLWYGFKGNPQLQLSVKPSVGQRVVSVGHITEWIEKKLEMEFQRIYVIPNMDDLIIPLMCDNISSDLFYQKQDPDLDVK